MDSENVNWLYIYAVVENFEALVLYFYTIMHHYAPWFRQAGYALIFSLGMFAIGVQMFKIPFDRMKGVGYTFGMIALAGLLNSPTTNTPAFSPISDRELSVGGYWSYHIGHQVTGVFRSTLTNSWKHNIREMAGASDGIVSDSMDIAWSTNAERYADKFLRGVGKEAYLDYMTQCARPLDKKLKTEQERRSLRHVGVNSHTLGMRPQDATELGQSILAAQRQDQPFFERVLARLSMTNSATYNMSGGGLAEARQVTTEKRQAEELLKQKLAEENNPILGTTAYMIPRSDSIAAVLSGENSGSTSQAYEQISTMGTAYAGMLREGATSVDPNSEHDFKFYPKNCHDLYLIVDKTMANFREAVKSQPEYANLDFAKGYQSQFASMHVTRALADGLNEQLAQLGVDEQISPDNFRAVTNATADTFRAISEWINKHMINYKIPALITAMALVSVLLVISFPLFATLSVIFGHKLLITYLKLVALPFLIVFVNQLLIQVSTNIIAFNNQQQLILNTFYPGTSEAASALSGQNIKAIIFSVLTVAELAIVKFLLFDDFRAVTSGNPGSVSTTAMGAGAAAAGAGVAIATAPARMAVTAKRLARPSKASNAGNISSSVQRAGTLAAMSHDPVSYQYRPPLNTNYGLANGPKKGQSSKRDLSGQNRKTD
jgi:hypothetical protein